MSFKCPVISLLLSCLCSLWGVFGRTGPVLCALFTSLMKLMQMLFWVHLLYLWNIQVGQKLPLKSFWKHQTVTLVIYYWGQLGYHLTCSMYCAPEVFGSRSRWGDKTREETTSAWTKAWFSQNIYHKDILEASWIESVLQVSRVYASFYITFSLRGMSAANLDYMLSQTSPR